MGPVEEMEEELTGCAIWEAPSSQVPGRKEEMP